ncbi:MAG: fused response regulator/phosphatase [Acidobacteriota bacterium]
MSRDGIRAAGVRAAGVEPWSKVLVVDDEPAMLRAVERILHRDHRVSCHTKPEQALDAARQLRPHVAILDVQMAGMDGFELTRELKRLDPDLRVILMTGSVYGTDDKLVRAIQEEAFYFIHKPFDRAVLRILVERCLELRRLEDANRRHLRHLEQQMAEAQAFQQTMLPATHAHLEGLEIDVSYQPSTELAGDLCDYAVAGPGRVALLIADVVGHGASAAMLTALVKSAFHASQADGYDLETVVRRVSEGLAAFESNRFVTLLVAMIEIGPDGTGRLDYLNAGHEGGFLAPPDGAPIALASTGPPVLSVPLPLSWERRSLVWQPGSRLLLFTDGITEARQGADELGPARVAEMLVAGGHGAELLRSILDQVERFAPGPALDDRTLLTVHRPARGA